MQTRSRSPFLTIHTEGALLPVDLLQRILASDKGLAGLTPEDYHLSGEKLNEAINRSWNRLQGSWISFQTSRSRLNEGEPGTTFTRNGWLLPLFQELGYGRLQTAKAIEIEGKSYAISHSWGTAELPTPIHLVGCGVDIEKRQARISGASKSSPHSLMQELLNRDDTRQWGLVSNGLRLRVLRDNASLTRLAFVEFDLEAMFSGEIYADFAVLWLVCHQSRLEGDKPEVQWLERWSQVAQEQGTRALEGLRSGVEEAIVALGQGFLSHPANHALRRQLKSGVLDRQQYFRQLLRLVYRLIFLFVAEDRDLLLLPEATPEAKERCLKFYSTARLRRLAERQRGGRHADLWVGLQVVTDILSGEQLNREDAKSAKDALNQKNLAPFAPLRFNGLGLPVLGGFLFSQAALPDLEAAQVDNQALLNAVRSLAFTQEKNSRRGVDYKNLGSEELGSVYESLLELQPILNVEAGTFQLTTAAGNERKTSGSYYTNAGLIKITLDSALDPVVERAMEELNREDAKSAKDSLSKENFASLASLRLLSLKICDPACGSGHFLIAAARRIARRLAQLRSGDEEPSPSMIRHALREVIAHCIYGVDINPMAVELCKVNLWLEALEPGKPLTFLDAHIKCGNSLVGVGPGMDVYDLVIPDEAFDPVTGDDKKVASALKKRNKEERTGQLTFDLGGVREEPVDDYAARLRQVEAMPEDDAGQVAAKAAAYEALQTDYQAQQRCLLADLWTAAFFWRLLPDPNGALTAPTQGEWRNARLGKPSVGLAAEARRLATINNFFHWPLEFLDVFEQGGFNCIVGNPPWDMVEFSEQEYFSKIAPEIALAPTTRQREKLIAKLETENPYLYRGFLEAKGHIYSIRKYIQTCSRFSYSSEGRINLYPLFVELSPSLQNSWGRVGIIVPSAISMDAYNASLFGWLMMNHRVVAFYDFENKHGLFPAVDSRYRFCILTLVQRYDENDRGIDFCYLCRTVDELRDERRRFVFKVSDIEIFSPNTFAPPILLNSVDAKLAQKVYARFSVLFNRRRNINHWQISIQRMLSLSDSGDLFRSFSELQENKDLGEWVRLYSGKTIHQFNHRYATYNGQDWCEPNGKESSDPSFSIKTQYYVRREEVEKRTAGKVPSKWLLAYRDVVRATDERTSIATIIPWTGCDTHCRNIYSVDEHLSKLPMLVANLNSLPFDYFCRQKVISTGLGSGILEQLPVISPSGYTPSDTNFIYQRVLELIYTAYDLKPFAEDMGYTGEPFRWDEERRVLLRAELDAYYARLYDLTRDELRYILDPHDVYGPDFPGETFRVLKDKEIRQFGEYRTRRLVLEAWDRLEGVEAAKVQLMAKIEKPAVTDQPAPVKEVYAPSAKEKNPRVVNEKAEQVEREQPTPVQASFSDFGLYKCEACGKMVMGYEKDEHTVEAHKGKKVEWKKLR